MTDEEIFHSFQPLLKKEAARNFLPYLREETEAVARYNLAKAIRTYDPERGVPFPAYARALVHGGVTSFLRKEKRLRDSQQDTDFIERPSEIDETKRTEIRELLRKVLATLTREEREVFACLFLRGLTARETALRLALSYGRVKGIKAMLRLKVKNMLAQ